MTDQALFEQWFRSTHPAMPGAVAVDFEAPAITGMFEGFRAGLHAAGSVVPEDTFRHVCWLHTRAMPTGG
jgi:hypothetical protein